MALNNNDAEIPEEQLEELALQQDAKYFTCRPKAKTKPQRREPAGSSPRIVPMKRKNWIDIEPGKHSLYEYEISKEVIHFSSFTTSAPRRKRSGSLWRMKEHPQNDDRWKTCLAAKRRFQHCTDDSGAIVYFRALKDIQDATLLILHCRTMLRFRTNSSSLCTT